MTSKQKLLELEPSTELKFIGPFSSVVSAELTLSNSAADRVLFKIKTTAPRRYCVRPNSGHIGPKEKAIITIMLQPQDFDPIAEMGKHKFMVQSCLAPPDFAGDNAIDQAWKEIPAERIFDSRLKCTFVEESEVQAVNATTTKSVKSALGELDSEPRGENELKNTSENDQQKTVAADRADENSNENQRLHEQKLATENERLRVQLVELEKQHELLRQNELRLRSVAAQSSVAQPTSTHQRAVADKRSVSSSTVYAIAVILALLIGVLFGRFVL